MPNTDKYNWELPTVGASTGVWGTLLNAVFDDIDAELDRVKDLAEAATPADAPEFAANPSYPAEDLGLIDDDTFVDVSLSPYFRAEVDNDSPLLFRLTGAEAGRVTGVIVEVQSNDATQYDFTYWPDEGANQSMRWPGGEMPEHDRPGRNIWGFITRNGVTWEGVLVSRGTSTGE